MNMKRLLILAILLTVSLAEGSAQENIEALLNRNISNNKYGSTLRSAVKRDPETGEIVKRVYEVTAISNRALGKEFKAAFKSDCATADACQEVENGSLYDVTAVWTNPKRIYTLSLNGSIVVFTAQIIYHEEKKSK